MRLSFVISGAVLLAGAFAASSQTASSAAIESGRAMFRARCSACHGQDGAGGRAPELTSGHLRSGNADADIYRAISAGVPNTEMPAWKARIKEADIWNIVTFLHSERREAPARAGDAARGEALFWGEGDCGKCHGVDGRGNLVGPDLSRAGRRLSASYMRDTILHATPPARTQYRGVTVVTRDGKKITGVEKALDDFSVVLIDFDGKVYSFDRANVLSVEREKRSLMPGFGGVFSGAEVDDLVAYLETLNGAAR